MSLCFASSSADFLEGLHESDIKYYRRMSVYNKNPEDYSKKILHAFYIKCVNTILII